MIHMKLMERLCLVLACIVVLAGCSSKKSKTGVTSAPTPPKNVVVTPAQVARGTVALVNTEAQFVVISFAAGTVLAPDQKLSVYRGGLKVGEVKVSADSMGQNRVADIVVGEAKVGDEVRPE